MNNETKVSTWFRADDFIGTSSVGTLLGFFRTKKEAESVIHYTKKKDHDPEVNCSRITKFTAPAELEGRKAWESGNIIEDYYYA